MRRLLSLFLLGAVLAIPAFTQTLQQRQLIVHKLRTFNAMERAYRSKTGKYGSASELVHAGLWDPPFPPANSSYAEIDNYLPDYSVSIVVTEDRKRYFVIAKEQKACRSITFTDDSEEIYVGQGTECTKASGSSTQK